MSKVISLRLNVRQLAALDEQRKAQEIIPSEGQATMHYFCKGLGIPVDAPEDHVTEKAASKPRKKR